MRVEHIGDATLYLGDCLEILPSLGKVDAVVTDPPYGMAWNGKVTRGKNGTGKQGPTRNYGETITNDDRQFDPFPWLHYSQVIMFGFQHFNDRLPPGTVLVWLKRYDSGFGSFLSDADIAWMKGGCGVYCFRDLSLQGDSNNRRHPTEKPVPLMRWCIEKTTGTVRDPFMGSGTTGVACANLGRKFEGIEIEEKYFDIACRRIRDAYKQPRLFEDEPAKPAQLKLEAL